MGSWAVFRLKLHNGLPQLLNKLENLIKIKIKFDVLSCMHVKMPLVNISNNVTHQLNGNFIMNANKSFPGRAVS